jgi:outer membrane biosynthesis protein TonB
MILKRIHPDMERLLLALLLSWLLHAVIVIPSLFATKPPSAPAGSSTAADTLVTRLVELNPSPDASAKSKITGNSPNETPSNQDSQTDSAEPPSPELEQFFPAEQLDKRPRPQGEVDLDIAEAAMVKQPGSLVLKIWIDSLGRVVAADIESSSLPARFTQALAETFGRIHFEPGELYGRPVGSILRVEITHQGNTNTFP